MENKLALITRPLVDAEKIENGLSRLGINSFIEPFLEISLIKDAAKLILPRLDDCQALVATSANAIRAVGLVDKKIITVGEGSAKIAKQLGYKQIYNCYNNVETLEKYIEENFLSDNGGLLYICGDVITKELSPSGFKVKKTVVYNSKPIEKISDKCKTAFKQKRFDYVLLFSKRTAEAFSRLAIQFDLKNSVCCSLSEKISEPISGMGFKDIVVCKKPNSESLLELIKKF